jgi:hypothetical protein
MQKLLTLLLLTIHLASFGQNGMWKPFKLIVIKPDTAIIDNSLLSDIAGIEAANLKAYYSSIKQMEELLSFKDYPKDMEKSFKETQEKMENEIIQARAAEEQVKKFKYFETVSSYSTSVYNFYFNEYEPFSSIKEIPCQQTNIEALRLLADSVKAEYVVFFSAIHTIIQDGRPVLKLTTSLYSKEENQIILSKETEGDTNSRGDMWTCNMDNTLSCLLINGVRTSTDEIASILRKRQIQK